MFLFIVVLFIVVVVVVVVVLVVVVAGVVVFVIFCRCFRCCRLVVTDIIPSCCPGLLSILFFFFLSYGRLQVEYAGLLTI